MLSHLPGEITSSYVVVREAGNFTQLLEWQIHFALKLFVGCPLEQF